MQCVPPESRDRIFAKARAEWPTDFEMQKHTIERQVAVYNALGELRSHVNGAGFVESIFAFSNRSWPGGFEMELQT